MWLTLYFHWTKLVKKEESGDARILCFWGILRKNKKQWFIRNNQKIITENFLEFKKVCLCQWKVSESRPISGHKFLITQKKKIFKISVEKVYSQICLCLFLHKSMCLKLLIYLKHDLIFLYTVKLSVVCKATIITFLDSHREIELKISRITLANWKENQN